MCTNKGIEHCILKAGNTCSYILQMLLWFLRFVLLGSTMTSWWFQSQIGELQWMGANHEKIVSFFCFQSLWLVTGYNFFILILRSFESRSLTIKVNFKMCLIPVTFFNNKVVQRKNIKIWVFDYQLILFKCIFN